MKKTILMTALLTIMLSAPVFAAGTEYKSETNVSKDDDGDMKADTSTSSTDSAGTNTSNEKKVTVDQDSDGDYKKTTKKMSKRDPKGLFNSSKTSTKDVVKKKGSKVTKEHTKKVNGDTVEDNTTESDTSGK